MQLVKKTPTSSVELWRESCDVEISPIISVAKLFEIQANPVSSLVRKTENSVDKSEAFKFIKMHLVVLCDFFGVSWNDTQISECSKMLYENYFFWTTAVWKHFSARCMSLFFGKIYGAFSPAVVMEWAKIYNADWMSEAENIGSHEHDLVKKLDETDRDFQERKVKEKEDEFHQLDIERFKQDLQDKKAAENGSHL